MGFQTLFTVALGAAALFAILAGGKPERLCAIALVTAALWTGAVHTPFPQRYAGIEVGVFAVDSALLLVLIAIALSFDRFWPLWMVGLQAMGVAAHLSKLVGLPLLPLAYQCALVFWSYPIVPLLAVATWRHLRRRTSTAQTTVRSAQPARYFSASSFASLASMMGRGEQKG